MSSPHEQGGRRHRLVGTHSAKCVRQKHEDWQHGLTHCAVGEDDARHCDCKAHWEEIAP